MKTHTWNFAFWGNSSLVIVILQLLICADVQHLGRRVPLFNDHTSCASGHFSVGPRFFESMAEYSLPLYRCARNLSVEATLAWTMWTWVGVMPTNRVGLRNPGLDKGSGARLVFRQAVSLNGRHTHGPEDHPASVLFHPEMNIN